MILMDPVPWYMLSPSPVSILQYLILSWIVSRHLIKTVEYKRFPQLLSFVDGFMIMGFFVVLCDAFWCIFCALKWLPLFPQDLIQILSSFARDAVACFMLFLLIGDYFLNGVIRMKRGSWILLGFCILSLGLWFLLAPSIAYTDYTFAWKAGYPLSFVFTDFVFSHFLMRIPLWLLIVSVLNTRRKFHKALKEDAQIIFPKVSGVDG